MAASKAKTQFASLVTKAKLLTLRTSDFRLAQAALPVSSFCSAPGCTSKRPELQQEKYDKTNMRASGVAFVYANVNVSD